MWATSNLLCRRLESLNFDFDKVGAVFVHERGQMGAPAAAQLLVLDAVCFRYASLFFAFLFT